MSMKLQISLVTAATLVSLSISARAAENPASADDIQFDVQPLTVSVSRVDRDAFGNPVHPFTAFNTYEADPGTVVLAKVTPRGKANWKLQPDQCRVASFRDDLDTDLSTNAAPASADHFFPRNRPLEVLTARDNSGAYGLRVRSQRLPGAGATRLIADVVLLCRLDGYELSKELQNVVIETNQVVVVGPLQVKFFASRMQGPASDTNQPTAQANRYLLAAFLPQDDVAVASVAFFSSKSDEPILVARDLMPGGTAASANPYAVERQPKSKSTSDPFADCVGYGFTPPADGKVAIKVRYFDAKSLVEKHCVISTGLSP